MNAQDFTNRIHQRRPRYAEKFRPLMDKISTKGDASGKGNFSTFGAFYQTYIYAFLIGYKLGEPKYLQSGEKPQEFNQIEDWKPSQLRDFVIMILMNESEKFPEPFSWIDLANASEDKIDLFVAEFISRMEAYANAGLEYLQDKWDNNHVEFEDPFVFVNFLEEINASTSNLD